MKLSRRQTQIVQLISEGLIYKEIADELGISVNTIKVHVQILIRKLEARNIRHAAVIWLSTK